MKILHVLPAIAARYGGPSVAMRALGPRQAARGHEVHVATTDADGPSRLDVPLDEPVIDRGVVYHYFPRTLNGEFKFSWPLTRWLYEHVGGYDVVHVSYLFSYSTIPACRAARRAGVPYVVRPLGTLDAWSLRQKRWKKAPYYWMIERSHLASATAIHATSAAEADAVARLGFGARTHVVELGVDGPPTLARRPAGDGPLRLLYLSRVHPKKGIPLLLDAMADAVARGAALDLTVAGSGQPAYLAELRDRAGALGIADRVRFVGHVEGEAKWALLADAELFVLPSSQENFGIAVAEALAAGVPVLVSDQVAIAPQVADAGAGRVVPLDRERLRDALIDAFERRRALPTMGERALALARSRYSWERTAAQLDDLYELARSGAVRRAG